MIQIDGKGFIKGTNTMYESKVVVIKRFSTGGIIVLPDNIITLKGDALAACLGSGKVRRFDPEKDAHLEGKPEEPKQSEVKTEPEPVKEKKLGPKKSKKAK